MGRRPRVSAPTGRRSSPPAGTDGADLGRGQRAARRRAPAARGHGRCREFQPRRVEGRHRQRGQDGADLGRGQREAPRRAPAARGCGQCREFQPRRVEGRHRQQDGTARIWDVGTKEEVSQITQEAPLVLDWARAVAGLRFSEDGDLQVIPLAERQATLTSPKLAARSVGGSRPMAEHAGAESKAQSQVALHASRNRRTRTGLRQPREPRILAAIRPDRAAGSADAGWRLGERERGRKGS